jgi:hypothetical protein
MRREHLGVVGKYEKKILIRILNKEDMSRNGSGDGSTLLKL